MTEVEKVFQIGDVVKVIADITAKDFEGNEVQLPKDNIGTVVELAESEFQLEIECVVENDLVVATVYDDQVKLLWRDREI